MSKFKEIRYIISYEIEIPEYPHVLYKTFEAANKKRLLLSQTEGKILKVVISTKEGIKNGKKSS